jgi:hypothetical protein
MCGCAHGFKWGQDLQAQIAAADAAGLPLESWIEQHAAAWRAAHPIDDLSFEEFDAYLSELERNL